MAHDHDMHLFPTIARWAMYLCIGGWALACLMMLRLPPREMIHPDLHHQPIQASAQQENFTYRYLDQTITVTPVADYVIRGLVVSHNNPDAWYRFDITHDERSLNTRDLCIIWGENLKRGDYRNISFVNHDWSCEWRHGKNVAFFSETELSNNHLITDSEVVRDIINNVRVGDQVLIRGRLVNYSEERWNGWFRRTSVSRHDEGNGACEIIFVHDLVVLSSYNTLWTHLREFFFWAAIGLMALRITLFFCGPESRRLA